jgi:hypothetical protein
MVPLRNRLYGQGEFPRFLHHRISFLSRRETRRAASRHEPGFLRGRNDTDPLLPSSDLAQPFFDDPTFLTDSPWGGKFGGHPTKDFHDFHIGIVSAVRAAVPGSLFRAKRPEVPASSYKKHEERPLGKKRDLNGAVNRHALRALAQEGGFP